MGADLREIVLSVTEQDAGAKENVPGEIGIAGGSVDGVRGCVMLVNLRLMSGNRRVVERKGLEIWLVIGGVEVGAN